ncbi:MAG: hypothetical protein Q7J09_10485 [Methanocalculus sp.]|uniref:hypothetical protein n=1 Tax=Methanocalculus sp. TaxID=2004547 RepID=UPI002726EA87|nr:hypothetical protein [Methanocalculus sp.]MDO9540411.1 hypothetical protein [Methanocalculus sp.]
MPGDVDLYCGYLPLQWVKLISEHAAPHCATKAAALIWHRSCIERRGDDLVITHARARECVGLTHDSLGRGLDTLQDLDLITTTRSRGRAIRVSIVDFDQYKRGGKKFT